MAILELLAQTHSSIPYVHMGFIATLYNRTLFSRDNGDFLPKSQYSCLNFRSICFLFFTVCSLQVNFLSICIPKYLTDGDFGINMFLKKNGGHCFFLNVNVTCVDLVSFILIFHLVAQASNRFVWCCRRVDAVMGSLWLASIAASSAKVPVSVFSVVGKSDVYKSNETPT